MHLERIMNVTIPMARYETVNFLSFGSLVNWYIPADPATNERTCAASLRCGQ